MPEAIVFAQRWQGRIYCGTAVGGCGATLVIKVGHGKRVPHLSHPPSAAPCRASKDPDRWTHLHIQNQVKAWAEEQGASAVIEYRVAEGRTDLHIKHRGRVHRVEVQLSPISVAEMDRRTRIYAAGADSVTWLAGSSSGIDVDGRAPAVLGVRIVDDGVELCWAVRQGRVVRTMWCPLTRFRLHGTRGIDFVHRKLWGNRVRKRAERRRKRPLGATPTSQNLGIARSRPTRVSGAHPLWVAMRSSRSQDAGRPVDPDGYPLCIICGMQIDPRFATHWGECRRQWVMDTGHCVSAFTSNRFVDAAEYIAGRMQQARETGGSGKHRALR